MGKFPTVLAGRAKVMLAVVLAVVAVFAALVVWRGGGAVLATNNDPEEVRSCLSPAGLIRIVPENTNCMNGEEALNWKNIGIQRYEAIGTVMNPINPAFTWLDVPNTAITRTFGAGKWKVTFGGVLQMSGGNGTAYLRIQVRPTGGTAFEVGQQTYYRFQSPLPSTEASTEQIYTQALVDLPAGEVTVVPQVYGPTGWVLLGNSSVIVEK